ncbi:hypothetical protein BHM03_00020419 [Ensete ventricosum]|nr:hypothetical protein BHM03_00020419 [Ensete ventricosum]
MAFVVLGGRVVHLVWASTDLRGSVSHGVAPIFPERSCGAVLYEFRLLERLRGYIDATSHSSPLTNKLGGDTHHRPPLVVLFRFPPHSTTAPKRAFRETWPRVGPPPAGSIPRNPAPPHAITSHDITSERDVKFGGGNSHGDFCICGQPLWSAKLLQETCNYIRSLSREVDDLSDRLSALVETMDNNSAEAEIVRSLLRS